MDLPLQRDAITVSARVDGISLKAELNFLEARLTSEIRENHDGTLTVEAKLADGAGFTDIDEATFELSDLDIYKMTGRVRWSIEPFMRGSFDLDGPAAFSAKFSCQSCRGRRLKDMFRK